MIYFIVFLVTALRDQTLGYDISLSRSYAVSSDSLDIIMDIRTINTLMTLYRPDGSSAGTCLAPLGGIGGACSAGLTQDLTNGITTYSIASVSRTTDEGVWTSTHGSESGSINITVYTIPTVTASPSVSSLTLSSGTSNTQSLTITVTCAYPRVSLDLTFVPTGGGTALDAPSSTSTCTPTSNTGCTDTDANSYTCDITPQHEASLSCGTTYYIKAAVQLAGLTQSTGVEITLSGTEITIQAPPVDCNCIASIILMSLSIVITVITVVLLVVLYLAVCGKKEWKCLSVFRPKDKKSTKNARCELTQKSYLVIAIAIKVISVIGFIIAVVGYVICLGCDLNNNGETIDLILAVVGFVLTIVGLVVVVLSVLIGCGIIKIKTDYGLVGGQALSG